MRNMTSVGIDLAHWVDEGLLQFRCIRPSLLGWSRYRPWPRRFTAKPRRLVPDEELYARTDDRRDLRMT